MNQPTVSNRTDRKSNQPNPKPATEDLGQKFLWGSVAILAMIILGFFFYGVLLNCIHSAKILMAPNRKTTFATVTTAGMRRNPSTYTFRINDQAYTGRSATEQVGEGVEVSYLPSDPNVNRPTDLLYFDVGFVVVVLIFGIIALGRMFFTRSINKAENVPASQPRRRPEA